MKFVLASYGTRGDIESCAAVGLELLRRGHDARMAAVSRSRILVIPARDAFRPREIQQR